MRRNKAAIAMLSLIVSAFFYAGLWVSPQHFCNKLFWTGVIAYVHLLLLIYAWNVFDKDDNG